jgi:hypothetical protein
LRYSRKEWDAAFDEIQQDHGISTVPIIQYVILHWWGPMQSPT